MRSKDLPTLLRAIANSENAKNNGQAIIFEQAAIELEKLDTIEALVKSIAVSKETILEVINDKAK